MNFSCSFSVHSFYKKDKHFLPNYFKLQFSVVELGLSHKALFDLQAEFSQPLLGEHSELPCVFLQNISCHLIQLTSTLCGFSNVQLCRDIKNPTSDIGQTQISLINNLQAVRSLYLVTQCRYLFMMWCLRRHVYQLNL